MSFLGINKIPRLPSKVKRAHLLLLFVYCSCCCCCCFVFIRTFSENSEPFQRKKKSKLFLEIVWRGGEVSGCTTGHVTYLEELLLVETWKLPFVCLLMSVLNFTPKIFNFWSNVLTNTKEEEIRTTVDIPIYFHPTCCFPLYQIV